MPLSPRKHGPVAAALIAAAIIGGAASLSAAPSDAPFLTENANAMTKMMAAMEIKPSGNVDRDFVDMMVPHHQGAVDMAQVYLRYGHNEQLRRLAQEIIVNQQQEIAVMRLAVGEPLPPSAPAPTQATPMADSSSTPAGAMTMSPTMKMK